MKRRTVLRWSVSLVATWPFFKMSTSAAAHAAMPSAMQAAAASAAQASSRLPAASLATLRDVAAIVLPSALTRAQRDAVVDGFQQWLAGYKSGAEISHGYGVLRARVTPAISSETYARQLAAIAQAGTSPDAAATASMRTAIESALTAAKIDSLPAIPDGTHIIADFMSFYFGGSEANDVAYGAKIGRESCRGLSGSSREPERVSATSTGA